MDKNLVLVSTPIIFKEWRGKTMWFITKQEKESPWELPKIAVRKAESSARASIRLAGEQLGMDAKVLEEAGRAGGTTSVNGKVLAQRQLYYLMRLRDASGEVLGFEDSAWLDYASAVRKLSAKRDKQMLKGARKELVAWSKREKEKEKLQK